MHVEFKKQNKQAKEKERERERDKLRNGCLTTESKQMVTRGKMSGGWVKWVMGIKKCTCPDQYWVIYEIVESLYCIPASNITLYINHNGIKINLNFF